MAAAYAEGGSAAVGEEGGKGAAPYGDTILVY
jgi:hypothetical protein